MDPESVLEGKGAMLNGGRFASVGTAAVYLAESDAVASHEVTARKERLGGAAQISLDKYPRIVFTVEFTLQKVADLTMKPLARGMAPIRDKCLAIDDITWVTATGRSSREKWRRWPTVPECHRQRAKSDCLQPVLCP
jgi:RES domain-containing protein